MKDKKRTAKPRDASGTSSAGRPSARRRAVTVAVLACVALVVVLALRNRKPAIEEPAARPEELVPLPPPSVVAPLSTSEKAAAAASASDEPYNGPPMDRESFNKRKAEMTTDALNTVDSWIKYPLWSSPLTENMQYKPPVPVHAKMGGGPDGYPQLELYMEKVNYAPGETVRVFAKANGKDGPLEFDAITGKTVGGMRPRPELWLDWVEQPDRSYAATLAIPSDVARKNRGEWGINADCSINGQHLVMHTLFYEMATDAKVTGPYRVVLENGSLSVYVTIEATAASRQHLKGELWTTKDAPIAYAWVRNDQTPVGTSEMKLVFYGKTIRDAGFDGPYVVRNLLLTTFDDTNDRIENEIVDPKLTTPPYKRDAFTDVPINGNDPTLNEKKKILEGELKKAQGNGYDPAHPQPAPPTTGRKDVPPPQ